MFGLILFAVTQAIAIVYPRLLVHLLPPGTQWTKINALLGLTLVPVNWLCRPLFKLILHFGGFQWISALQCPLLIHCRFVILRSVDLVFWLSAGIGIAYFSKRSGSVSRR